MSLISTAPTSPGFPTFNDFSDMTRGNEEKEITYSQNWGRSVLICELWAAAHDDREHLPNDNCPRWNEDCVGNEIRAGLKDCEAAQELHSQRTRRMLHRMAHPVF
jgi:hypothetical protein